MKKVLFYIAIVITIPILIATLIYNIQLFQIQSFAQTSNNNNNNNFSNTADTKDVLNTEASGQKVVLRGIESSKIFNNASLNTGEKPQRCINTNQ